MCAWHRPGSRSGSRRRLPTSDRPGTGAPRSPRASVRSRPRTRAQGYHRVMSERAAAENDLDDAAAVFLQTRPRLFGIAYRILGSAADAEDIVQETWLRWQNYDRATVREPAAFLATTTTRLAINLAQSAHSRREAYVGPW